MTVLIASAVDPSPLGVSTKVLPKYFTSKDTPSSAGSSVFPSPKSSASSARKIEKCKKKKINSGWSYFNIIYLCKTDIGSNSM